jgi:hypothetical protein
MPKTDKSITVLTGMIIAALYVILLVGFSQESYMRHDAARRNGNFDRVAAIDDVSKRVCRAEFPFCALFADAGERQNCMTSIEAVRSYLSASKVPLTLEGVRRVMNDEQ